MFHLIKQPVIDIPVEVDRAFKNLFQLILFHFPQLCTFPLYDGRWWWWLHRMLYFSDGFEDLYTDSQCVVLFVDLIFQPGEALCPIRNTSIENLFEIAMLAAHIELVCHV